MNTRLILILASLLWLISCKKKSEDLYRSLDHTQWFKYEEGDTLVYACNSSQVDTYVLESVSTYWANIYSENIFDELLEVSYQGIAQCNNCPLWGFTRIPDGTSFSGDFHIVGTNYSNTTIIEYNLRDTIIYNVYEINNITTEDTNYYKVKALYYSNVYGYIRYDMYDDRVYELQLE